MMHDRKKSDSAIIAVKSANKVGQPTAEPREPRAEAEGNASQQRTRRAQDRESVSQALERIRKAAKELQRRGRRNGSRRSSTISARKCFGQPSSPSGEKLLPASMD